MHLTCIVVTDAEVTDELGGSGGGGYDDDGHYGSGRPWWRRPAAIIAAAIVIAGLGIGLGLGLTSGSGASPTPEGVPVQHVPDLASANSTVKGAPVDGITCRPTMDQGVSYHIHVHVAIFVNGQQVRLPAGAGIVPPRIDEPAPGGVFVDDSSSSCLYWLHVHANDGIIHVEAPRQQNFVLGQFFDIWGQPLSAHQVGPAQGPVTAFVNGKVWTGDPRNIPLLNLEVVQLDVGSPVVPFKPLHFTVTGACSTSCAPPPSRG
jgi:hypothetical protein